MSGPEPDGAQEAGGGSAGWGAVQGKATSTLLLRHGATALSGERRFSGREDVPLTKDGVRQARQVARRLAAGRAVDVVLTSPLERARRTAEAVSSATGAPLVVDDDLVEADFGAWQGLTFAEAGERWPDELKAWLASPDARPPDGESFAMVALRVLTAQDRLLEEHRHKRVVVVSHVTPIKTLICRALLAPPEAMFRMNLDVASLTRIDCFDNGSALLRSFNDTAHLRQRRRR